MQNEIRITLRLPADLHGDIVAIADRYKTSLNGQIVTMLRDWFTHDTRMTDLERRLSALESRLSN